MIHHHQHKRSYFWLYVLKSAPDRVYGDVSVSNAVMMFCWASCCFRQTCFRSETHLRVWSWFFFFFSSDRLFPPSWIRVVSPHQRVSLRFPRLTNQPQHPRASPETSRYTYERARAHSHHRTRGRARTQIRSLYVNPWRGGLIVLMNYSYEPRIVCFIVPVWLI